MLSFHFFAHPTNPGPDAEALSRLYALCVSVIQTAYAISEQINLPTVSQAFIERTITLAGFSILRLVRSPIAQHLDLSSGEQAFSQAVQFLKNVSLQPGDISVRIGHIMSDLWNSNKVFRRKDGRIESLGLRLRTRLSMSISYDMFWYWREEFGNMSNPYNGEDMSMTSNNPTQPSTPRKHLFLLFPPLTVLTELSAYVHNQPGGQELQHQPTARPPVPLKLDPSLMNPMPPAPSVMSFDTWDGSDYNPPPMLDQFPDYDWAAGFDFSSSELPNVPVGPTGPINPMMQENVGYMGHTFG